LNEEAGKEEIEIGTGLKGGSVHKCKLGDSSRKTLFNQHAGLDNGNLIFL
jgi:hypothetical protein